MPEITRDGLRLHYDLFGRGAPLLLLHGSVARSEFWIRAGYVDPLSTTNQLVLLDFRGHGASSRPHDHDRYGLRHDVADVVAVMDVLRLSSAAICGWSYGGNIALGVAALHPERARSVMAIGASGYGRFVDLPGDRADWPRIAERIRSQGMAPVAEEMGELGGAKWISQLVLLNDPLAIAAWLKAQASTPPLPCRLQDVARPVRFVAGDEELPRLHFTAPRLPRHSELTVIPGANHVSAFTRSEIVVPLLRDLLERG